MNIRVLLKDSLNVREYETKYGFWEGNNTLYIRTKNNTLHVYPMCHVWRLEINKLPKLNQLTSNREDG